MQIKVGKSIGKLLSKKNKKQSNIGKKLITQNSLVMYYDKIYKSKPL